MRTESHGIADDTRKAARSLAMYVFHHAVGSDDDSHSMDTDFATDAIAKAIHDAVMAERERIILLISEQASALAEAAIYGLAENARSREAMEAALTKFSHIIRVAALPAAPKAEG